MKAARPPAPPSHRTRPNRPTTQPPNRRSYVIGLARKLGCAVFVVWEDILEHKPKVGWAGRLGGWAKRGCRASLLCHSRCGVASRAVRLLSPMHRLSPVTLIASERAERFF